MIILSIPIDKESSLFIFKVIVEIIMNMLNAIESKSKIFLEFGF